MASHFPFVIGGFDAADCPIAIVGKAGLYSFDMKQIGKVNKAWLSLWPIVIDAELCIVVNFGKD
jgi:hypothetical protein